VNSATNPSFVKEFNMVIVYESKTGFTKKYAEMLGKKTNLKVYHVSEVSRIDQAEEILFLGWVKVGKIQGLNKVRKRNLVAVCGSGTGETAEPNPETMIARNRVNGLPFFYLRGGCLPLKEIKGFDGFMLSMFVKMLKNRKKQDGKTKESIEIIENGFDGVKEENLEPVLHWLKER
jgi:hypothetical protein